MITKLQHGIRKIIKIRVFSHAKMFREILESITIIKYRFKLLN